MATLMDVIMQEYRGQQGAPDYTLGSRRTMMQPGGQFNDAGRLGNMGLRQVQATQAPAGTSPITPGMPAAPASVVAPDFTGTAPVNPAFVQAPNPFAAPNAQYPFLRPFAPQAAAAPMRPSPFDETNMAAPSFAPAALSQGATNAPLPPRIPGGQTRGVREPGFFERLFGGTQYQSNNLPVVMQEQGPMPDGSSIQNYAINFGDPNRTADFFAADRALMQQNPAMFGLLGGSNG